MLFLVLSLFCHMHTRGSREAVNGQCGAKRPMAALPPPATRFLRFSIIFDEADMARLPFPIRTRAGCRQPVYHDTICGEAEMRRCRMGK